MTFFQANYLFFDARAHKKALTHSHQVDPLDYTCATVPRGGELYGAVIYPTKSLFYFIVQGKKYFVDITSPRSM